MAGLLSIDDASALVLREALAIGPARLDLPLPQAHGHVLAEAARADRDFPPFDRSMMDGYALRSADAADSQRTLEVIATIAAGQRASQDLAPGQAYRIFTGAPVPQSADCVVMQELTEAAGAGKIRVTKPVKPGANISRQASDVKAGGVVISAGTRLGPAEIAVLASVGQAQVGVFRKPRLAVLATGDEIIEPHRTPTLAQIRNSNSYQALAQAASLGLETEYLGIAPDEPAATRALIERGLQADLLVTTGGVSVGDKDHVGATFKALGVEIFFNKVNIKPGKPTTFGRKASTLVFGLPGNPVAALVCFHMFVALAARARMGFAEPQVRSFPLRLRGKAPVGGDRVTLRPAKLLVEGGQTFVTALEWHGSGDLCGCVGADGLIRQHANTALEDGECVDFYPFGL